MTGPASANRPPFSGAARLADDTRRRFLAAIVARVPLERLVEVHLFPPIRQGGVETGVAVVAALRDEPAAPTVEASAISESATLDAASCDLTEDASVTTPVEEAPVEEASVADARAEDARAEEAPVAEPTAADAPVTTGPGPYDASAASDALVEDDVVPPTPARARHTVFTGRYRLTLKGPDRGRWEADVVEEATAPLVTVEAVVRGVQRRAGDTLASDRLGPELVARILGPAPNAP